MIISNAHISLNFNFIQFVFYWLRLSNQCFFCPHFRQNHRTYVMDMVISILQFPLETLTTLYISISDPSVLALWTASAASARCSPVFNRGKTQGWVPMHWVHSLAEAELERGWLAFTWWFLFLQRLRQARCHRLFQNSNHSLLLSQLLQLPLGVALAAM